MRGQQLPEARRTDPDERYRLYIDESGDHMFKKLAEPSHRFLCLIGSLFRGREYKRFHDQLEQLKQKFTLGIVSNGNSYPETLGVEKYFQFVILAQNVGVEKPDPGIFHLAVERAGCLPDEFLYVGDSQEEDVLGARRAGIRVAWYNRMNAQLQPDIPQPDYEISRLSVLLEILNAL